MVKVEEELPKLDEVSEFENKETSQFDAVMGKRNTRYTSREELSDVVLKTLRNPGASRRHLGCSSPWE